MFNEVKILILVNVESMIYLLAKNIVSNFQNFSIYFLHNKVAVFSLEALCPGLSDHQAVQQGSVSPLVLTLFLGALSTNPSEQDI